MCEILPIVDLPLPLNPVSQIVAPLQPVSRALSCVLSNESLQTMFSDFGVTVCRKSNTQTNTANDYNAESPMNEP